MTSPSRDYHLLLPCTPHHNFPGLVGDYPVRLLTRRTLGLEAESILNARLGAPRSVQWSTYLKTRRRPPA